MTRDDIIRIAREAGMRSTFVCADPNACPDDDECCHKNVPEGLHGRPETIERFANLIAAAEREAIAQMIEDAPPLVDFAKNEQDGCIVCGFTPKLAALTIRSRGQE